MPFFPSFGMYWIIIMLEYSSSANHLDSGSDLVCQYLLYIHRFAPFCTRTAPYYYTPTTVLHSWDYASNMVVLTRFIPQMLGFTWAEEKNSRSLTEECAPDIHHMYFPCSLAKINQFCAKEQGNIFFPLDAVQRGWRYTMLSTLSDQSQKFLMIMPVPDQEPWPLWGFFFQS